MNTDNKLANYGGRGEIKELADRIVNMIPGSSRFTTGEALTLAQIAIAHGLDPFTGELWGIKGDNGKWYGTMIGIAGRRKKSREQAAKEGGVYWIESPTRVDPAKYERPDNEIVYEVALRDTVTMQAYSKSLHAMVDAGIPYQEAIKMIGNAPVWVGVGIAAPSERSKMNIHALAKKRAENAALKMRYDISLTGINFDEGDELPSDTTITIIEPGIEEPKHGSEQEHRDQDTILSELGFSPEPVEKPEPEKIITPAMDARYVQLATKALELGLISELPEIPQEYDTLVKSGKDLAGMIAEEEARIIGS